MCIQQRVGLIITSPQRYVQLRRLGRRGDIKRALPASPASCFPRRDGDGFEIGDWPLVLQLSVESILITPATGGSLEPSALTAGSTGQDGELLSGIITWLCRGCLEGKVFLFYCCCCLLLKGYPRFPRVLYCIARM